MTKYLMIALLVAAPAFGADDAKTQKAIQAVFSQIDACVAKGDSKCIGALFAEDATFSGPIEKGKMVKGRAGIAKFFESMMQGKGVKQERTVQNVRFIGEDRAFADCSVKSPGGESADGTDQHWHTAALLKLEDDKWLLEDVRFYVVETRPPPTPGPTKGPTMPVPTKAEAQPTTKPEPPAGEAPKS